ncbi:Pimeloyl-ACP methyl ester carboxylesterase [Algoriphagus locisalis]|uniref:Pimeloyl-ACP methyl ester carboxylesterase n=1 Tax=Algoriphagus locisalis TaxID=305507 RepID=A0A1I7AA15_9BACT|nr:alpha/beta hydrolase [Algoriphagus locisalis]SFT71769.1 Pimeloyl-ACP methyl ester carboxylesterase [Algoriphagus locisalis]
MWKIAFCNLIFIGGLAFLLSLECFAQSSSSDEIFDKYSLAKNEFEKFEKQHGHFLRTRNTNMHYLTWGNDEDMPVIWIHGSFTNSYEIKDLADKITAQGYYLIAIDYYGHGLTPIPHHEVSHYHVADDILDLMDHLQLKNAVIGGWSRGGYIASAFYDSYPDRVKALILEDGGSVAANTFYQSLEDEELNVLVDNLFKDRVAYKRLETEFEVYREYQDPEDSGLQFELLAWINQDKDSLWTIGSGVEKLFHMASSEQFLMNIRKPSQIPLFARSMVMIEPLILFRNLKVPMLILDPVSEDDLFPFQLENELLKNLHPDLITHKIYRDTEHNIHYERPEEFLKDILGFLSAIE